MSTIREIKFQARDDPHVELVGHLWTPSEINKPNIVCVMVHPWGILGGSESNTEPYARILSSSYGIQCFTFDLRGVGDSTGSSTFRCHKEVSDVLGACDWIRGNLKKQILLLGSSAGASIAGSALPLVQEVTAFVGIGYTFGRISGIMFSGHYDAILNTEKPKLFIMGTRDEFTSVSQLQQRVSTMKNVEVQLVEDVGHFALENSKYAKITSEKIFNFIQKQIA
jgi:alpha/beta superfamily hydrolase